MKICVITPGVVHAVPRTLSFAAYFEEVHYIDTQGKDNREELETQGIIYHPVQREPNGGTRWRAIQRLLREIRPDGIVCHFASGSHFFHSIIYNRCPVAVIVMGSDVFYEKGDLPVSYLTRSLIRMGLRRAEFICAKSRMLAARIKSFGCDGRMEINYWGADPIHFAPGDKRSSRRRLGLPEDGPIVLSPRAVQPIQNTHIVAQAFDQIRDRFPNALLVVVGRTMERYKRDLDVMISQRGMSDKVRFAYEVNRATIVEYFRASDIVVSMGSSEGFPNTLLEVMACERPMIVGRIPQVEELLVNGKNAVLCAIEPEDIGRAMALILARPELGASLAAKARSTFEEHGNIRTNGRRFAGTFRNVIEMYKRSGGKSVTRVVPLLPLLIARQIDERIRLFFRR